MIVVQFDMPMPEHCCDCPLCHDYMWCRGIVDSRIFDEETDEDVIDGKRQKWCPLKEQEAKHGEWIDIWREDDPDTSSHARCSVCNRISTRPVGAYCKWCGAKMDDEVEGR